MIMGECGFERQHHSSIVPAQQSIRCLNEFGFYPNDVGQKPPEAEPDKGVGIAKQIFPDSKAATGFSVHA
jgi:hypothetical protein